MKSSLQVDISHTCNLNCKYCVSKMNPTRNDFKDCNWAATCLINDLQTARQSCDTMVLTGTGEPLLNKNYLEHVLYINKQHRIFEKVELQTNGLLLSFDMLKRLKDLGVTLVAVSTPSLDPKIQEEYTGSRSSVAALIDMINYVGLTSRITYILTDAVNRYSEATDVIYDCLNTGAEQITLKRMWRDGNSSVSDWIANHDISEDSLIRLRRFIYSSNIRLDEHCMDKEWLILRPWGLKTGWHETYTPFYKNLLLQ